MQHSLFRKICSFILLAWIISLTAFSQNNENLLLTNDPAIDKNEKVFVQLNKSTFVSGENIHYKAFIVNASSLKRDMQSKVIYFELVGKADERVLFWRNNVINGNVNASFLIPDTLQSGIYTLRAYTNWMRNKSYAFYFSTNIMINRFMDKEFRTLTYNSPCSAKDISIDCFPENGKITEGLPCQVGVKISCADTSSKSLNCIVKDNNDSIITSCLTDDYGIGSFSINAKPATFYTISAVTPDGKTIKQTLKLAESYGTTVKYSNNNADLNIDIASKGAEFRLGKVKVVLRSHGKVAYNGMVTLVNEKYSGSIPIKNVLPGIAQLLLLDEYNKLIYSSLIYIKPENIPSIRASIQKSSLGTKEKTTLEVSLNNVENKDTANLSVLITENYPFELCNTNLDIVSYLLFYSEIANSWDISCNIPSLTPQNASNILLCTPYNDYFWAPNNYKSSYLLENKGYILTGKITDRNKKVSLKNVHITLAFADSVANLKTTQTDSTGTFHFLINTSYDNRELVMQLVNSPIPAYDVVWDIDNKNGHISKLYTTNQDLDYSTLKQLENFKRVSLVNAIFLENTKKKGNGPMGKGPDQNFYTITNYSRIPADYFDLENFDEIVANLLPGVRYRSRDEGISLNVFNIEAGEMFTQQATVLLNGVPFTDFEYIATLGSKGIKRIEINQSRIMFGDLTFYGVISITTPDGKIPSSYLNNERFVFRNIVGQPDNNAEIMVEQKKVEREKNLPDFRQMLYFNRTLQITDHNKATINYSTSELKTNYRVVIQGVTEDGIPLSYSSSIEVK